MGQGMDEALESPRRLMGLPFDKETFPSGPVSGTLEAAMVLDAVSAEAHQGFERVVFTFHRLGSSPGVWADLPAVYAVSADAPPFTFRASGEPLAVAGRAFLRVNSLELYGHACSDRPTPTGAFPHLRPAAFRPGPEPAAQARPSADPAR